MSFEEYLNQISHKHPYIDVQWIRDALREVLTEDEWETVITAESKAELADLNIMIGVRQNISGNGSIVSIYKDKEVRASRDFLFYEGADDE